MKDEASDQNLLEAARGGDAAALEELLVRYQPRVYRFGVKMCGDPEDAKDVLQETLLAMARGVRDFRGASSLTTWLYTIARSFCVKKRRHGKFAPAMVESIEQAQGAAQLADPRPDPEETATGRQIETALARAIASIEPAAREVLVLRDIEGLSAAEVAEVAGITVDAVKSRLHRARLALRTAMLAVLGEREERGAVRSGCPDVLMLFSRHLEGEISPDLCADLERHLAGCPHCRGECESLKRTLAICHATREAVPAAVQKSIRQKIRAMLRRSA